MLQCVAAWLHVPVHLPNMLNLQCFATLCVASVLHCGNIHLPERLPNILNLLDGVGAKGPSDGGAFSVCVCVCVCVCVSVCVCVCGTFGCGGGAHDVVRVE